uniref:Uncharacterized protein n=1 Tax=Rhizophora mucronata TaxID=61149 RepID=A0A2P2N3E8_RHIMU
MPPRLHPRLVRLSPLTLASPQPPQSKESEPSAACRLS